jgi:3',5'-cyclic AMP phosphodiesterase CpdA
MSSTTLDEWDVSRGSCCATVVFWSHVMTSLFRRCYRSAALPGCQLTLAAVMWLATTVGTAWAVDTVWNFGGDLSAAFGTGSMTYRGDTAAVTQFGTTSDFGLPSLFGSTGTDPIMAFPAATPTQGYTVTHNAGAVVNQYTMVWDILYPESSDVAWRSLMQTSQTNSNDGDFFVQNLPWGGVGIGGQYHGVIKPGEWNRVALTRDAGGTWSKYINGGYVGEQNASDSRFALDPTLLLFADENNETRPGYVSSFRFVDSAMSAQEIRQLGGPNAAGAATPGQVIPDPSAVEPGSFTIAVLGDTQNYSQFYPNIYAQQTQWLVDNKSNRNIQFMLHVGDVVNFDDTTQWNNAAAAMSTLDGQLNYAVVPGNHDYANNRAVSQFNQSNRFGPGSPNAAQSTLAGFYPAEPDSRMNTYHTFDVGDEKFLVLALEFGPRDGVVDWAASVADSFPDRRVILLTHAYMYDGGQWFNASVDPNDPQGRTFDQIRDTEVNHVESIYNPKSYGWATGANDGKDLWDKLVKQRENMSLVISGHQFDEFDGFPYKLSQGENGNDVYQLLVDMQNRINGGDGWIRLLEFSPDGTTVTVKSYSPFLDEWSYASDEYFTIQLSPIAPLRPGDYNDDGFVDAADYTVWRNNLGAPAGTLANDVDGGVIGTAQYATWKSNFGMMAGGSSQQQSPVPEPATALMLALAALATSSARPRRNWK